MQHLTSWKTSGQRIIEYRIVELGESTHPAKELRTLYKAVAYGLLCLTEPSNACRKLEWGSLTRVPPPRTTHPVIVMLCLVSVSSSRWILYDTYNIKMRTLTIPIAFENMREYLLELMQTEQNVRTAN